MKHSNEAVIKMVEQATRRKKKLTHITEKSKLSTQDLVKLGLCRHFVQFTVSKGLKLKQVAKMISMPIPRVSEIINYKISKFTVDQLLKNLSALGEHDREIKEFLVFFSQAAELPTLAVGKTRQLTRDLKDASVQV